MDKDAATLHQYNSQVHQFNYDWLVELEKRVANCADIEELADYGYALNRLENLLDDTRKKAKQVKERAQHIQCALQTAMSDISGVRTEHCTATPHIEYQTPIPKKESDPEAYFAICELAGISREAAELEIMRPHWPGVSAALTELAREGKPWPEGIDPSKVKPVYSVRYRKAADAPF